MALTKYKLGDLIYEIDRRNSDRKYGLDAVRGISNNKEITPTKASVTEDVIAKFYVIKPGEFIYNPRTTRMGEKVGMGFNDTEETLLFSFNNIAFGIKNEAKGTLLPRFLYMYYNRPEFDRYAIVNSWGSATELFTFDEMCDIDIDLPPLDIQQKYVDVYNAMLANQQSYERGLEDLKLVCDAYIEELRREMPSQKIGQFLLESDRRNDLDLPVDSVRGLATSKEMIPTKADMKGVSLASYKMVIPRQIAYVPDTSRRGDKMSLGINNSDEPLLVSSISEVFGTDLEKLLPEYLMLFLTRSEFDRYARFNSWGSARETFNFDDMCDVEIPIPDIKVQKAISDIYAVYVDRKQINDHLKERIKSMCPILIKGSLEEAGA
ncbi:restriction endonuclease subunit S [Bilifractor sp. HCP3S3_D3]|uniref:restriction endonuclease subunit S n=1 Tax=Bilifractor sp. HCP3S3_D3 TaxID=3438907 RepID=UPI003F8993FA